MCRKCNSTRIPFFIFAFVFLMAMTVENFFSATKAANGNVNVPAETTPSLKAATGWLNTQPLTLRELRGKVVLVDFWTYTCINWLRTVPYVREWAAKYKDQGLIVIGVHTPEFSFEKNVENVRTAVSEMNITYPVALDNNYEVWDSFKNRYWPAVYLVDAKGRIRYQKFGEEGYEETERQIQLLLNERNGQQVAAEPARLKPQGVEAAADWKNLQSPETYVGSGGASRFASPQQILPYQPVLFSIPPNLRLNEWGLSGSWMVAHECIQLSSGQGKIRYRFHARDVHLVMTTTPGTPVRFRVLINGQPPGEAHGSDIDSTGNGVVTVQRLYQLVRQQGSITDADFEIEFMDPMVKVYAFTFG